MKQQRYGRYETLRLIASGGMASVYLGRALGAGGFERLVAIKVMHPHIAHEKDFVAMFLDEARLAARIRHPNVVPTLDVASDGTFLVMEYVEGASLFSVSRMLREEEGALLPLPVALRIFIDGLEGLEAAHELTGPDGDLLNIVHRDVSPQNILVGVDGISRITDFGVAHARSRITSTRGGQLKGKLPYMAPEQLRGERVDRRTDVYAAGVMLWELLTGAPLFSGDSDAAIACSILDGPARSPRELNGAVPAAIDEVCMRAVKLRDGRIASAAEFIEDLEDAMNDSGIKIAKRRAVGDIARQTVEYFPPTSLPASSLSSGRDDSAPYTADGDWRQAVRPNTVQDECVQDECTVSAPQPPGIAAPALGEPSSRAGGQSSATSLPYTEALQSEASASHLPASPLNTTDSGSSSELRPAAAGDGLPSAAAAPAGAGAASYTQVPAGSEPGIGAPIHTEVSYVPPAVAEASPAVMPPVAVATGSPLASVQGTAFAATPPALDSTGPVADFTVPARGHASRLGVIAVIGVTCAVAGVIIFFGARAWIGHSETTPAASPGHAEPSAAPSAVLDTTSTPAPSTETQSTSSASETTADSATPSASTTASHTATSIVARPPRPHATVAGTRTGGGTSSPPRTVPVPTTEYHPPLP